MKPPGSWVSRPRPDQWHAPESARRTIAYARVPGDDQRDDRERQEQVLDRYCARQGWTFEVISDLGRG